MIFQNTRTPKNVEALITTRALDMIDPYEVPQPQGNIDLFLNGNEGFVPTFKLSQRLEARLPQLMKQYPSLDELQSTLADRWNVSNNRVLPTAGADEALDRLCRAFGGPGAEILIPTPSFEMLRRYALLSGAKVREIDCSLQGGASLEYTASVRKQMSQQTRLVIFVTPNNPTGAVLGTNDILTFANDYPNVAVGVDLAYIEFATDDPTLLLLEKPNVFVIRTLSKAWSCAGLRIGYLMGPPEEIAACSKAGGPYTVSALSNAVALEWLRQGSSQVEAHERRVRQERQRLLKFLSKLSCTAFSSQANFVLARFDHADWLWHGLASLGILVRSFPGRPSLKNCLRISCSGDPTSEARLLHAVETLLRPEALLFDLDGVLVDVSKSYRSAIQETVASFGSYVSLREIENEKLQPNSNNDWIVTQRILEKRDIQVSLSRVRRVFEQLYQGTHEAPGLRRYEKPCLSPSKLAMWGKRYRLGVVTGRPRDEAQRCLAKYGFAKSLSVLVAMEDAAAKPSPEPVQLALQELGVTRAWMLGDMPDDLRAAQAAVVVPIGVLQTRTHATQRRVALEAAGAASVLQSTDQLEGLLP